MPHKYVPKRRLYILPPLPGPQKNLSLRSHKKRGKKCQKNQHHINMYGDCPEKKRLVIPPSLPSPAKNLSLRSYKKAKNNQQKQRHINMYGYCPQKKRLDVSPPLRCRREKKKKIGTTNAR